MHYLTLTMIVKDEASNLERCLSSVAPYIDYYVICDTGSTDNTKEVIRSFFDKKGIKGEILDCTWVDFGHNRSIALKACLGKTHWALMIDADDSIEGDFPHKSLEDKYDGYEVGLSKGSITWKRTQIFNLKRKSWKYVEPLHEYPTCEGPSNVGFLEGNYKWVARCEGNRIKSAGSENQKYINDYILLKNNLIKNPDSQRSQFYAAQSAFDAGLFELAESEYLKRTDMGGWEQELFYSWYRVGICRAEMKKDLNKITEAYLNAFQACPQRAESLYKLSCLYRAEGKPNVAFIYAFLGSNITFPKDGLFVENDCYNWGFLDELGVTCYYANQPLLGYNACKKLLKDDIVPDIHKERIKSNIDHYKEKFKDFGL